MTTSDSNLKNTPSKTTLESIFQMPDSLNCKGKKYLIQLKKNEVKISCRAIVIRTWIHHCNQARKEHWKSDFWERPLSLECNQLGRGWLQHSKYNRVEEGLGRELARLAFKLKIPQRYYWAFLWIIDVLKVPPSWNIETPQTWRRQTSSSPYFSLMASDYSCTLSGLHVLPSLFGYGNN